MTGIAIQDEFFAQGTCYGCGPANERGLRLKSYRDDGQVIASFTPWPEHGNGFGSLNGGIIATLLDCHSAAAVIAEAVHRGWWAASSGAPPFLTAGIDVRYLRPSPLDRAVEIRAEVDDATEVQITCSIELRYDDKPRAAGRAVWKRVPPR